MVDEIILTPTSKYAELKYKFLTMNPFQSQFEQSYDHESNCVCSAPTGSGKTVIAELCVLKALNKGKRAIFLAPMRALVREKYEEWSAKDHPFSEFGCSIMTGDYKLTAAKKKELAVNKTIIMTSEMLDSRSRRMNAEGNSWLLETDVLVIDEAHIIGMFNEGQEPLQERGHRLEAAIMRFTKLNPTCRIVLLSATLPNLPQLGEWLKKLNGKETKIIVSTYRPQPLDWNLETYPEQIGYGSYFKNKAAMFQTALSTIQEHPEDIWLVFCHSKTDGRAIKEMIEDAGINNNVPFHSADLDKDERIEIESVFKERKHRILIATSTLAYGVNTPARRVLILDDKRGLNKVHPYDIKQMGGRAGRPGLDPKGDVHWVVGDKSTNYANMCINNIPPAKSQMFDLDVFAFHVVAEIAEGGIKSFAEIKEFYDRSLACFQGALVSEEWLKQLTDKLVECQVVKWVDDHETKSLTVTALGKIASWLYFSPFDIYQWHNNLQVLVKSGRKDDIAFAWAWASVRSNSMSYIPKDIKTQAETFARELNGLGSMKNCEAACVGLWMQLQGRDHKTVPSSVLPMMRNLIYDSERHHQAISLIDSMYLHAGKTEGLKMLSVRIKYGVGWDVAKLCQLPGIGKVRGEKLIKSGIKSKEDLIEKKEQGIEILGDKIYEKALEKEE